MALIYAFRDEAGRWYGDPDGLKHDVSQPVETGLSFRPGAGEPGANGLFAGQTLLVRMASIDEANPGLIRYSLDNGTARYATCEVEQLLFGDDVDGARRSRRFRPRRRSWLRRPRCTGR
jgi:hypothetical protein